MAKTTTATPEAAAYFDPMIYDIMRETANELRGEYVWLSDHAATETERTDYAREDHAVWQEAQQVDSRDRAAIEAKTAEYRARLERLRAAA